MESNKPSNAKADVLFKRHEMMLLVVLEKDADRLAVVNATNSLRENGRDW